MLKRPEIGEGSGLRSHFGVLAGPQFYSAVALELQAHGHVATVDPTLMLVAKSAAGSLPAL